MQSYMEGKMSGISTEDREALERWAASRKAHGPHWRANASDILDIALRAVAAYDELAEQNDRALAVLKNVDEVLTDAGDDWWFDAHYREVCELLKTKEDMTCNS